MTHLVIAGHGRKRNGGFDSGATGLISKGEHKYVSQDLFPAMKKHLPKGHNVVFFDEYNVYDYGNIVALANKYKADQVTEIHYDAASASASGGHVIIHERYEPDEVDLALRDAIESMVGVRYSHKGHKGVSGRSNLANVNRTANAGITYRLIELGFGTNKKDAKVMVEDVDEYAKALVKAITGTVSDKPTKSKPVSKPKSKSVSQMADEVIAGQHGSGHANRRKSLGISQSEYEKVRAEVNRRAGVSSKPSKSIDQLAKEVIDGKHGTGDSRKRSLGSQYSAVQKRVNELLGGSSSKSIRQMAQEVIDGKHGNGHEQRRKSLGISKSEYEKVRAEVNRRL